MLNAIRPELTKEPLRSTCQKNIFFAIGALRELLDTELCLFAPSRSNKYSHMILKFPLNTQEEFLECILDCVETLTKEPASFSITDDLENDGYILAVRDPELLRKLMSVRLEEPRKLNPWCLAGVMFVSFNRFKRQDNQINVVQKGLFGPKTFKALDKFNYLLL
jgi:hypothetical protein